MEQEDHARRNSKQTDANHQRMGTTSNLFWKAMRKIMVKPNEEYDTITEENRRIKDRDETKEYRAKYFEEIYQPRGGRPEFTERTKLIVQTITDIDKEIKQKPAPPLSEMKELR